MEKELARIEARLKEIDEQIDLLRSIINEIAHYLRKPKCDQCIYKDCQECSSSHDDDDLA